MEESNKRIVKNTAYLYIRQFFIMIISFVTTRVVLDKLGASDYGINNLVSGFVASFAVLNSILSSGTRRFLALYIGKNDHEKLKVTFSTAFVIHMIISIIVAIALETGGLWFLNSKLNIDPLRMGAAHWVFQLAVISTLLNIIMTPYIAVVTAHEKFSFYAGMSMFDVAGKLLIIYLLILLSGDKLIIYAFLQLAIVLVGLIIYRIYCGKKFMECGWSIKVDKTLLKEILSFSGWGVLGHVITVINSQGISIILNIFFNTVMNAARGLANTVNVVIAQFITGFQTAAQPQLVKFYGSGDMNRFHRLIFNVTQYTLFLMAVVTVPCLLELDYVVDLWLGNDVPPYTCSFVKITLICGIIYRSNSMIESGLNAIGRVKENNMYSVPVYLLSIPLVYFVLQMDMNPTAVYWIASVPPLLSFLINLHLLRKFTDFPSKKYFIQIFLKNLGLIIISAIVPLSIQTFMNPGLIRFLVVCTISVISTITILWIFGMNVETKKMVKEKALSKLSKFSNR